MKDYRLVAERRTTYGSRAARQLRAQGRIPANLYGQGKDGLTLTVAAEDMDKIVAKGSRVVDVDVDGTVDKAVIQELQWNTFTTHVHHVDLKRVAPDGIATADVRIELVGEPSALKAGGQLRFRSKSVKLTCSDYRVPPKIEVRIGSLGMGEKITVADVTFPEGMTVETSPDTLVVEVLDPRKADESPAPDSR